MLNDAQRAALADMQLPKPLQDMLDENIVDSRLTDYYTHNLPDYDTLTSPVNEARNRLKNELTAIAREPNPITRERLLLGVPDILRRDKMRIAEAQVPLLEPFIMMDVFLQRTTAIEENYRKALLDMVAITKQHTYGFMNDLLSNLDNDLERTMIRIEKRSRRERFIHKVKRLSGIAPK